jgi:hypothetical protein
LFSNKRIQTKNLHGTGCTFSAAIASYIGNKFSIYNSTIKLSNSTFINCAGDDGLNIKYSKAEINNCQFYHNIADQFDIDYSMARISNCIFESAKKDRNGDGIDLSGSYSEINNCSFNFFLDKSLSLGEKSKVLVHNCNFTNNQNAITIKDQTKLFSWKNNFKFNKIDICSYIKKYIYSEPELFIHEDNQKLKMKLNKKMNLHNLKNQDITFELKQFKVLFKKFNIYQNIVF